MGTSKVSDRAAEKFQLAMGDVTDFDPKESARSVSNRKMLFFAGFPRFLETAG
jgi:hypothetical protein